MASKKRLAKLAATLACVPAVFLLGMGLPAETSLHTGIPEALGCSGSSNVTPPEGWTWLKPSQLGTGEGTQVSVATDGFFVIDAEGRGLTAEAAMASVVVTVTGADGQPVAGTISLLRDNQPGLYLFGWTASAPLAVGTRLSAVLGATTPPARDAVGGEFELVVAGEPTPLPTPKLSFARWGDYYHGDGALVACESEIYFGGCGGASPPVTVPERLIKQTAVDVLWLPPAIVGDVAWELRVAPTEGALPEMGSVVPGDAKDSEMALGMFVFPTRAERYCVTLALKDLRTDEEKRVELCEAPQAAEYATTDTSLRACLTPPTAAVTEGWCALHTDSSLPACAATGSEVDPANPADPAHAATDDGDSDSSARTSSGCQLGGAGSAHGFAGALASFAFLLGRRVRRGLRRVT